MDVDPVANRIMPWLAYQYQIDGELYYNTVEDYNAPGSPWDDLLSHGGNGDGAGWPHARMMRDLASARTGFVAAAPPPL